MTTLQAPAATGSASPATALVRTEPTRLLGTGEWTGREDDLRLLVDAAEAGGQRPVTVAVGSHTGDPRLPARAGRTARAIGFEAVPGHGVAATVTVTTDATAGRVKQTLYGVLVGDQALVESYGVRTAGVLDRAGAAARGGATPVFAAVDGRLAGVLLIGTDQGVRTTYQAATNAGRVPRTST
jgi:P-type Cu+ transporter